MKRDGRSIRYTYYKKIGLPDVDEKRAFDILIKDNFLDKKKVSEFCYRYTVPNLYRTFIWKLVLGIQALNTSCRKFVAKQREDQYKDLFSGLRTFKLVNESTTKGQMFVKMWLLENTNITFRHEDQMAKPFYKNLVLISNSVSIIFENDVDAYWISRSFFRLVEDWCEQFPDLADSTKMLLKNEDLTLYTHLMQIDVLVQVPFEDWFGCCFAGTIHESALVKIWDKIIAGSFNVLMFVCIVLLTTLRRVILKCQAMAEIMTCVYAMSKDTAELIATKSIDLWHRNGRSLLATTILFKDVVVKRELPQGCILH